MYTHRIHGFFSFCYIRIHTVCMCIVWHMLYMYTHVIYVYTPHTWIFFFLLYTYTHRVYVYSMTHVIYVYTRFICIHIAYMDCFVHEPNAASFCIHEQKNLCMRCGFFCWCGFFLLFFLHGFFCSWTECCFIFYVWSNVLDFVCRPKRISRSMMWHMT